MKMCHELELGDLKLEGVKLRGQARRLEGDVLQTELFDERAREMQRLCKKEKHVLQEVARKLGDELYLHEQKVSLTAGTSRVLRREVQDLLKQVQNRRKELESHRAKRRRDAIDQVSAEGLSMAVQRLSRETAYSESLLETERLQWAALEARAHRAGVNIDALEKLRSSLLEDQARADQEMDFLEFQTALAKRERDKEEILDRFVAKHVALHHPSFVTERASQDQAMTVQLWQKISEALDGLDKANIPKSTLLLAKLRVELGKMHAAVLHALQREEKVADALVNLVKEKEQIEQGIPV